MRTKNPAPSRKAAPSLSLKPAAVAVAGLLLGFTAAPAAAQGTQPAPTSKGVWQVIVNLFTDDVTKVVLIVVATAGVVIAVHFLLFWMAGRNARRWTAPLLAIRRNAGAALLMSAKITDTVLQDRLKQQLAEIEGRIDHHFTVFVDFFKYYYLSIGTFSTMALVAAITLFFLSQEGVNGAQKYPGLVAVFVVSAAAAAFYKSFISVYRQPDNIADNKQLYKNYVALENDLRSFCAVGEFKLDGQTGTAADFIAHVDQKLAEFNNIAVGFDATKVESYDGLLSGLTKQQVTTLSPPATDKLPPNGKQSEGSTAPKAQDNAQPAEQPFNPAHPERPSVYEVKPGDTLEKISALVSRTADEIKQANPGKAGDGGAVAPGTKLTIPAQKTADVPSGATAGTGGNNTAH